MIKAGKTYRTRNGKEVRIFATDLKTGSPIVGAVIIDDGSERLFNWKEDGSVFASLKDDYDLIITPEIKSLWSNFYSRDGRPKVMNLERALDTRALADKYSLPGRTHVFEIITENGEPVDVKIHKVVR